jgi:hypothetical protein
MRKTVTHQVMYPAVLRPSRIVLQLWIQRATLGEILMASWLRSNHRVRYNRGLSHFLFPEQSNLAFVHLI